VKVIKDEKLRGNLSVTRITGEHGEKIEIEDIFSESTG
jgi:hypothetical protein